jgi:Mn2+/Fe2+ NRAMP family transporter
MCSSACFSINIDADLGAIAAAVGPLVAGPTLLYVGGFALFTALLQVFVGYERYAALLRWLSLSLLAYAATVFVVGVPWLTVAHDLVVPNIQLSGNYCTVVVAVFGTTISPYLFFWQVAEEVEDVRADLNVEPLIRAPAEAPEHLTHTSGHGGRHGSCKSSCSLHHVDDGGYSSRPRDD